MNDPLAPLLAGAFVIVCGLLVKRFPMLISGYNTLPKEKRKTSTSTVFRRSCDDTW